jgi:hypothetical protein
MLKKKIWAIFQRIIELFTPKIVTKLSKIWVWDPGSKIRDPEKTYSGSGIPDPGVKKASDPGSGSASLGPSTGRVLNCSHTNVLHLSPAAQQNFISKKF